MTAITPRADATIGVAVMAAVTIGAIAPGWSAIEPCAIAAAIVAGAALRAHRSLHLALSLAALRLAIAGLPFTWPFNLALGLIAYAGLAFAIGPLRPGLDWLRRGRLDLRERRLIVAFVLVACAALCGWVVLFDPDLSQLAAQLPDWPLPLLALAGLIFALVNAAAEEALFRGIMYRSIEATTGSAGAAVLLQAVCFGAMHMHGFPNGWVGVGLAVIFGVMTGALRALSGGLLAPFIAHVFADLTIFTLLAVAAA